MKYSIPKLYSLLTLTFNIYSICLLLFFLAILSLLELIGVRLYLISGLLSALLFMNIIASIIFYDTRILYVFILFYILGLLVGPYLEPPADTLDHLRHVYEAANHCLESSQKGLFAYAVEGLFFSNSQNLSNPDIILWKISNLQACWWAIAASILTFVGRVSGLPIRWALLSVIFAFVFMGTNVFSYFRYYVFGPSFFNMTLYWFWTGAFFFKIDKRSILLGITYAIFMFPVMIVNHVQESLFLAIIFCIWISLNIYILIQKKFPYYKNHTICMSIFLLLLVLFIIPQFEILQKILRSIFIYDFWKENQELVITLSGFHIAGIITDHRVFDTFGIAGLLPLLLLPALLLPSYCNNIFIGRSFLLGLLPLFVYCTPLLSFIWISNCIHLPSHIRYYYRMVYSSLFWLPTVVTAYCCWAYIKKKYPILANHDIFICFILLLFILLTGSIRRHPIYGKIDFLMVNGKPWWPDWKPILHYLSTTNFSKVDTDYTTGYVLHSVFGIKLSRNRSNILQFSESVKVNIREMVNGDDICIINLHGFKPSWVPFVSKHWDPSLSDTRRFYTSNHQSYQLESYPGLGNHCFVLK